MFVASQLFAFPCYFTLAKDSCWKNYDVQVVVTDAQTNKTIITVDVPKGQLWARQAFSCQPAQKFIYSATFKPIFWHSEVGKTYMALRYWSLPSSISKDQSAWNIPVCFPADFSAVPFPPDANGNCKCDFTSIPAIKPR